MKTKKEMKKRRKNDPMGRREGNIRRKKQEGTKKRREGNIGRKKLGEGGGGGKLYTFFLRKGNILLIPFIILLINLEEFTSIFSIWTIFLNKPKKARIRFFKTVDSCNLIECYRTYENSNKFINLKEEKKKKQHKNNLAYFNSVFHFFIL